MTESASENSTETEIEKNASVSVKPKHAGPGAWSRNDEQELINLWRKGTSLEALAKKYSRDPRAIITKPQRLGLNVVGAKFPISTTTIEPQKVRAEPPWTQENSNHNDLHRL